GRAWSGFPAGGWGRSPHRELVGGGAVHVDRLEALGAFLDLELDGLVLEETAPALPVDLRVVNEDVRAGLLLDETPALLVVEPLDLANCHVSSTSGLVKTRGLS